MGTPARGGLPATTAVRTAEGWRISGRKIYSTGSHGLSWFSVWARSDDADPLVGAWLVRKDSSGVSITETWDNGKAVRETLNADVPLAADHFRYFAGCIRAQEGSAAEINEHTAAYHFHEPLGVVGQIIPWNFPLLMAAWKLAPALAAGNCVVLKPAEQTPLSIMVFAELIADLLPAGVLNIVQGFGREAGEALATSTRIAKIAFTGSTPVGSHIMKCAAENIIPSTVELGGKSPNIFFEDIMQAEPQFIEKAAEGLVLAFFNQGEVCTCRSRPLRWMR